MEGNRIPKFEADVCPHDGEKSPDCKSCCYNLNCARGEYILSQRGN